MHGMTIDARKGAIRLGTLASYAHRTTALALLVMRMPSAIAQNFASWIGGIADFRFAAYDAFFLSSLCSRARMRMGGHCRDRYSPDPLSLLAPESYVLDALCNV